METIPSSLLDFSSTDDEGKEQKKPEKVSQPPQEYNDLISGLPLDIRTAPVPVRRYQGFWWAENTLRGVVDIQHRFVARDGDVFLMSYPKAGTTWLKALAFAVMTRHRHPLSPDHPLLRRNPHDCVPYLDELYATGQSSGVEALPSPRILASHMPYSTLPPSVTGDAAAAAADCRIVYICRGQKDVLASMVHFGRKMAIVGLLMTNPIVISFFIQLVCEGVVPFGPIWDHVLEYWNVSKRRPEKVLFLKYEDVKAAPEENVRKLAAFLRCPFTEEEEEEGVVAEIVKLCSFNVLKSVEANKNGTQGTNFRVPNDAFFRKAEEGDWRNIMNLETAEKLDEVFRQKLEGSGLTLGAPAKKSASTTANGNH